MLEQADRLLFHQLRDHVTEDRPHGVESLVRGADVREPHVVEKNLLHDEDGDRLAQLGAGLHDPKAQRDDLRRQEEIDDLRRIVLDQGPDDSKGGQAKVLERPRLGGRIEKGVEKQRDVGWSGESVPHTDQADDAPNPCAADSPARKSPRVSLWDATHCRRASALQTRFEAAAVSWDGLRRGYTEMISCNSDVMTPARPKQHGVSRRYVTDPERRKWYVTDRTSARGSKRAPEPAPSSC